MKNLEDIIKANTKDGVVDYAKVESIINEETNNVVAKNKGTELNKVLTDLGFEKVEDLKAAVGSIETLKADKETLKNDYEAKLQEKEQALSEREQNLTALQRQKAILDLGINDQDKVDYIMFNVNKKLKDDVDFNTALAEYQKEKPELFKSEPLTFKVSGGGNHTPTEKLGFEKVLEEKRPDVFKKNEN